MTTLIINQPNFEFVPELNYEKIILDAEYCLHEDHNSLTQLKEIGNNFELQINYKNATRRGITKNSYTIDLNPESEQFEQIINFISNVDNIDGTSCLLIQNML